jgi:hypothetical protein
MAQHCKYESAVKDIENLIKVQCSSGNYNYDPYMHGMANGLICAMSCVTGKEPEYISAPDMWLKDIPKNAASIIAVVSQ